MAAALECWSSRASTDEDMVEQVLMRTNDRSEETSTSNSSNSSSFAAKDPSAVQKKLQRLSRNVSEVIASVKNSLNLDSSSSSRDSSRSSSRDSSPAPPKTDGIRKIVWGGIVRSLTQLYPGSQLPEKLVSNIRKHYDSMPLSYAEAGFDMKEVFSHIKLIEQSSSSDQPAILIHDTSSTSTTSSPPPPQSSSNSSTSTYRITFASSISPISWPSISTALESASLSCKKVQIFERKGSASATLGILHIQRPLPEQERNIKSRIESVLRAALTKKHQRNSSGGIKIGFGLCGCHDEDESSSSNSNDRISPDVLEFDQHEEVTERRNRNGSEYWKIQPTAIPLPSTSYIVSVDEWQTIRSGGDELGKWLLNPDQLEFSDQVGPYSFKGTHKGKKVAIEKLKGCDKGNTYEFELRRDLLELMTCGHRNLVQFHGVCVEETHGLCVVTRLMEGGSVHDRLMLQMVKSGNGRRVLQMKDVIRIAVDVAEGLKFVNEHGVAYRDLNSQRVLLDKSGGSACLGDMGIVVACKSGGEVMDYETDGYRWLAPEIIAGDPESISETWMSNVYSYGMVLWEMVTGEVPYSAYSPVQAAVGIAACGLRPEIPKDCPQVLKSVMLKCWNNNPSKRPQFSEIVSMLVKSNSSGGGGR